MRVVVEDKCANDFTLIFDSVKTAVFKGGLGTFKGGIIPVHPPWVVDVIFKVFSDGVIHLAHLEYVLICTFVDMIFHIISYLTIIAQMPIFCKTYH